MTERIRDFLESERPETPCLVVDLEAVEAAYAALASALPFSGIHYAVKANPARPVLDRLKGLGSSFDAASLHEVRACLETGVPPDRIAFGNTVKKARDIAGAHERGVSLFAFDSRAELRKIAAAAPGASVFCRIFMEAQGAEWPLSRKFGCPPGMAAGFLEEAAGLGLHPAGVSFHVGSQQLLPERWDAGIGRAADIFAETEARGLTLDLLNIGGGFPARYRGEIAPLPVYGRAIRSALDRHFGDSRPRIISEPGRAVTGDAGVMASEVILVAGASREGGRRWVFLDIGKFGGLPETIGEAIRYRIETPRDGGPVGPVVIAGPTCDEVDVLYDSAGYSLPLALEAGDRIRILSAGAYTATYASVGFNGFPPPAEYYI